MTRLFDGTRRGFLKLGLASTLMGTAGMLASPALAALPRVGSVRALALHNLHTDEKLHVTYWQDGKYSRSAAEKLNHILRDHYSGDVHPMDLRLFDLVHDLQHKLQHDRPVEIISGYRSPTTNARLASYSDGVAKNSYHTKGMAMDIRMPGASLRRLQTEALLMHRGGVGYYPDSEFVHVDVGPTRRW